MNAAIKKNMPTIYAVITSAQAEILSKTGLDVVLMPRINIIISHYERKLKKKLKIYLKQCAVAGVLISNMQVIEVATKTGQSCEKYYGWLERESIEIYR